MEVNSLLNLGGPIVYILLVLSIYATAIILYKLHIFYKVQFFKSDITVKSINLWLSDNHNDAYESINNVNDPQAEVVSFAMYQLLKHKKLTVKTENDIREEITRLSDERINNYSSNLNSLQVIATIAPLLGLLGTVFGMIEAFQQMEMAGKNVDPSILSGGIWEALLTTAAGLSVAIPIVVFESYFRNLIDTFKNNIENAVTKVLTSQIN
ncbi:MAG: MotA/TolQ/ExbB proton channel family protein [Gammaproteobacteria bacterium]|mgnify:FL=1|jgi:biopolymer transport protein ExbB|nr:MotA/TolQ/ExbB proton channel family protein [Gammaproteobacteria bacterium]MBT4462394.1 MotA/TolQ/ExbB proton channel family protein [Gammaproteobacteria bacterium]MBT4655321.1 MotA/TolQ/ExbB proton channel family protein [Gammaproteobacteria bacterium]MBT5117247.1 MotA/TolQ/ExbB proton channel family protein [Gammaproteobacteria bacterium]MBT5762136.1 MotA/TolQ/ExbB proton channel family protein [Gammaproteobacteria bacterium]